MIDAIILNSADNIATAVRELASGDEVSVRINEEIIKMNVITDIPYGHKFAVHDIEAGDNILKYGEVIGRATADIAKGCHAHVQNIESLRGRGDLDKEANG